MHVFEMVVLIVLIGGVVSIINNYMGGKRSFKQEMSDMGLGDMGLDDLGFGGDDKKSFDLERLEQLEERVAVLEKIVTDSSYDLKKEFEKL